MQAVAEQDRESHLERLRRSGEEVRMAQQPAVAAATRGLSPDDGGSDLPAPPATGRFVALLRTIERAQGAAWDRRSARLAATRSRLIDGIVRSTVGAVKCLAAEEGAEVLFSGAATEGLPDATETFREPLRRHWAGQPGAWGGGVTER